MTGLTFPMGALLTTLAVLLAGPAAGAETVALQQGVGGYAGCTTRTIGPGDPKAGRGIFPLRGSRNRLHVRFELPQGLSKRKLARARLGVFLPSARKPNVFTEIFCHEVTAAGEAPAVDEQTDYDNGRRPGAGGSSTTSRRWGSRGTRGRGGTTA